jgi:hypothetical protein
VIRAQHLHTYFLVPFSIDKEAVLEDHPEFWKGSRTWLEGLDDWLSAAVHNGYRAVFDHLGAWKRHAYTEFTLDSRAYQDMAYFHRFVRRIFFDAIEPRAHAGEQESLLRCYVLPIPEGWALQLHAEDDHGGKARVNVTGLQLFLFANGIGILSIAIEESDHPYSSSAVDQRDVETPLPYQRTTGPGGASAMPRDPEPRLGGTFHGASRRKTSVAAN